MFNKYKVLIGAAMVIILSVGLILIFSNQGAKNSLKPEEANSVAKESTNSTVPPVTEPETNSVTKYNTMPIVKIQTNKGDITLELFPADAPKTVANFIALVKKGFYDGVIFHRVISGFMIQGGDPTGTGSGGPNYQFADELNPETPSYKAGYVRGTLAMANAGPNTNGSQFFIMHQDKALPQAYTIFGRVISGLETVDAIAAVKTDPSDDRPLEKVIMEKVEVVE